MKSLYEINQAILACSDPETGEVVDIEALIALDMERTDKLEGIALWIKNLDAEATAIKQEEAALADRRKAKEAKVKRLKELLTEELGGQTFETARVRLSFRASTKTVIDDPDTLLAYLEGNNLEDCIKRKPPEIATAEIGKLLKSGQELPGAALVKNQNLQIK